MLTVLEESTIAYKLWGLITDVAIAVILSIGRQGIDVLLLRSAAVAFILGVIFVDTSSFPGISGPIWLIAAIVAGLVWMVIGGPLFALMAALANLAWYRSFGSLRPQLRIFNRR